MREAPVVRREAPVLLPAVGGFQFGRRPNVVLAVGELFARALSARSQALSACHIARRMWVSIRPKAERSMLDVGELFVWARSARSQARSACVIAPLPWASCLSNLTERLPFRES